MYVGSRQQDGQRDTLAIRQQVAFGARPAPVCQVGADGRALLFTGMDALSIQARSQSS